MAAYAALVSLMNDLKLIPNHPTIFICLDNKQISSLSKTVHFLIEFMESYDFRNCSREAVEALEREITSAALAAHDVIESRITKQISARKATLHHFSDFIKRLSGMASFYFSSSLQRAIDHMEFVKGEVMQFEAQEQPTYSPRTLSEPLNSSGKKLMVGFDAVAVRLLDMLTGEPSSRQVIPIVGMGGIGKTTLAKYAYQHLLIQQRFDVRLWATISQKYSIETIHKQLLFRETSSAPDQNHRQSGEQLHKMLWGRRYLVVLDDMWSVGAWDEVARFLPDNGNGSRVIVTTRLANLAAHLSSTTSFPFEMNFLDKDKSWELFCGEAFGEEGCPVELEKSGKKIVKRCRGLPLSIVVIGGHLRKFSTDIVYWEKVANDMDPISGLGEDEQCLEIISLSYVQLSVYLKPCFLYMAIYPEDGWIDASELVKFWVAEGFIKSKMGMSLEEVAEDYLKDLADMNLVLVRERRWNGKVESCVIHDMVRELCLKVANKEKFLSVVANPRHLTWEERRIVSMKDLSISELPMMLRSLVIRGKWCLYMFPRDLSLLRLLSMVTYTNMGWHNFQHFNLRYLAFSGQMPSSISLMWNMQTLIMHNYDENICEPFEIWKMTQLRHLEFVRGCIRDPVPGWRSNRLENLHTLIGVENLRLTKEVCKRMPNIKKLSLRYNHLLLRYGYDNPFSGFGGLRPSSDYHPQNFHLFNNLESLSCSFSDAPQWRGIVLRLRFPPSLQELSLHNSQLGWGELTTMIKSLSHLGSLALDSVRGPEWDLDEEEFGHLKVLRISRCRGLINWNASSSNFPVLEILHISEVRKLNEIPSDIGEIPTLRRIELIGSSAALAVSALRIAAEQESCGNEDLELDVGFWGKDEVERFHKLMPEENLTSSSLGLY